MKMVNCWTCKGTPVMEVSGDGVKIVCPTCNISTSTNPIQEWAVKEWNTLNTTTRKEIEKMVERSTPKIIQKRLEIAEEIIARDNMRQAQKEKEIKQSVLKDVREKTEKEEARIAKRRGRRKAVQDGQQ